MGTDFKSVPMSAWIMNIKLRFPAFAGMTEEDAGMTINNTQLMLWKRRVQIATFRARTATLWPEKSFAAGREKSLITGIASSLSLTHSDR